VANLPPHRRRFTAGVVLATAAGLAASHVLLRNQLGEVADSAARRRAVVALSAATELVRRAGGSGDAVRRSVADWQGRTPGVSATRAVLFDGLSLEASTAAADVGDRAAPRRLTREEKPLYDLGQQLRAAVETNREEGRPRKHEVEAARAEGGELTLAAPLELDGQVAGMVELRAGGQAAGTASGASPLRALGAFGGAVAAFLVLSLLAGGRRWLLLVLAVAATAGALAVHGAYALSALEAARRDEHQAVSAFAREQAEAVRAVLEAQALGAGEPVRPGAWDVDVFRQGRGMLDEQGGVIEAAVAAGAAQADRDAWRALLLLAGLSLGLVLATGLGGLSRLGAALVQHRQAYAYIAPAIVGMVVLVFFPFFYGITLSFTDANLYNSSQPITETWIGLRNYGEVLLDFQIAKRAADGSIVFNYLNFYWTFLFTIVWTVCNVTIGVTVGLLLALVLNTRGLFLRPIYRVLLILPWAVPNYITALIWKGMFHQQYGVVNQVFQMLGAQPVSWFNAPTTSFITALCTNGWLSFPFMMVVSLGALQSIPGELYEAARVDGASRLQQFSAITLPALRPALVPAIILSVVWTFNMFNIIYLVTAGEPGGSTEILVTQAYKFAFERYRYGYAAAYSTVIFGILLLYGTLQNRVSRATEAA
jgi:arabinogalactan oligomer/maltooligosaccharide transport system permease protein